jgi:MFS family permease
MLALFSGAALINAAMAAASAVSTIVTADQLGPAWAGVPSAAGVVGTGIGALALTAVMTRWGRRLGLVLGYLAAAAGAAVAAAAVAGHHVIDLCFGMLLLGLGNAGGQLSRYAAAELYPSRRGAAIGVLIWAGTIGAVAGPLLLAPSGRAAAALGLAAMVGPFLFASLAAGTAVLAASGVPGPAVLATSAAPARSPLSPRSLVRTPAVRSAFAVMVTGQLVMVAVMTAAPVAMHLHGQGLGSVGSVLAAHTLGMFALSPVTGRLLDRVGARPVMYGGLVTLAIATGLATVANQQHPIARMVALFLLGYGWNLCFVGGSGQLARDLPEPVRARVEGAVDAAIWSLSAVASLASTAVLATGGYPVLAATAGALAVIPAILLRKR